MKINWTEKLNFFVRDLVNKSATDYETRVQRNILLAGAVGIILILLWKRRK